MFKPKNDDLPKPKPKNPTGVLLLLREWWPLGLTAFGIVMAYMYAVVSNWQNSMSDMPPTLEAISVPSPLMQTLTRSLIGEPIVFFVGMTVALIAACFIARSARTALVAVPLLLSADVCAAGVYLNNMLDFCSVGEIMQTQVEYDGHVYHAIPVQLQADSTCSEYAAVYRCEGETCPLYAVAPYPYSANWTDRVVPFEFVAHPESGTPMLTVGNQVLISLNDNTGSSESANVLAARQPISVDNLPRLRLVGEANPGPIEDLAFSPDSTLLAAAGQTGALQYPVDDLNHPLRMAQTRTELYNPLRDVTYSIDGRALLGGTITSSYTYVAANTYIWNREDAAIIDAHIGAEVGGTRIYSPDARHYAEYIWGQALTLGSLDSDTTFTKPLPEEYIRYAQWSPDGRLFASADNGGLTVWDADSGQAVLEITLKDVNAYVSSLEFSRDSRRLLVRHLDISSQQAPVSLFDLETGALIDSIAVDSLTTVMLTPDAQQIYGFTPQINAGSSGIAMQVWDLDAEGHLQAQDSIPIDGLVMYWMDKRAFTDDGQMLMALDNGGSTNTRPDSTVLRFYQAQTGQALYTLELPDTGVAAFAISPDSRLLATAGLDGKIRLYAVTE